MSILNSENTNIVVYTAIVNNYEILKNPDYIDPKIKYICFTDQPIRLKMKSNTIWEIRKIPSSNLDHTRKARQLKILPHVFLDEFKCDYSIWIDGNITITGNVFDLINLYGDCGISGFKHPLRNCIYQEAEACIKRDKDDPVIIKKQMDIYKENGFPKDYGLYETNVLIRKHSDKDVIRLMNVWWEEIKKYSKRDQLSFTYVIWRENFNMNSMADDNARANNSNYFLVASTWRTRKPLKWYWEKYVAWRFQ